MQKAVLGARYDLSVAFLSPRKMREAMRYRYGAAAGKKPVSNVLSFSLSKTSGEILICKSAAKPYSVEFLFIHGLLHLKGRRHGATMKREEDRLLERFGFSRNG
jgi:ssRNA-specific RNase YbeY (16S rRNA maturation enzyme)